uniref:Uncharacterized protein n=1 Tax=Tanacetum cinerariifolium TaxID=118510 RepID=A0A6L2MH71_TANCI|nr:hypothetical protein [Tanacetum cinerariifolium]
MAYKSYLAFTTRKTIHKKAGKRKKAATTTMKETSLIANDNIISEDLDVAHELAKPMNKTKAEEQEVARLVHETHKHDDEEDDNDNDQSIDLEETDDEENKHDNEDQAMNDTEKNDEDKPEKEKDTDQEPIQDKQTKDEALMESLIVDENAMDQGVTDLIKHKKRLHDDDDRDQDPPAGPDQRLKKRKTSKDAELFKKRKPTGSSKDTTQSQPKSTNKSPQAEKIVFEAEDTNMLLNQGDNLEKPPRLFDDLMSTHIDFSAFAMNLLKISRLTVPVNFFFNNDLEYLRGGSTDRKYTPSIIKTKAAKVSRHDVYSTMRILSVTIITADEWYGYGYLKEIVSKVKDLQLGVESYQKKLNIFKPRTRDVHLFHRAPYTTLSEPQGVIYKDKLKRKRLMRIDKLYKFSDDTLTLVHNTLD